MRRRFGNYRNKEQRGASPRIHAGEGALQRSLEFLHFKLGLERSPGNWVSARILCVRRDEDELHPGQYIGKDGVLVRLGASWRPEMMKLEPHLRIRENG